MVYYFYDIAVNEKIETDKAEFDLKFKNLKTNEILFFDSEEFHLYHEKNADVVYVIGFLKKSKPIGYCIAGVKTVNDKALLCVPYSSPFSNFYFSVKTDDMDKAVCIRNLKSFAEKSGANIKLALPPDIYDSSLAVNMGLLIDEGFELSYSHVNNYYDIKEINSIDEFVSERSHSFRKNLNKAVRSHLVVRCGNDENALKDAYEIIKKNRDEKNYPLYMSYKQILDISGMDKSEVDAFIVSDTKVDVAAAIVFKINSKTVQVIYWGASDEYSNLRPMEFLAVNVIRYYRKQGFDYIDIGPSTADDRISHGLLRFKKNIGCKTNFKPVFLWQGGDKNDTY